MSKKNSKLHEATANIYYLLLSIIIYIKGKLNGTSFNSENANQIPIIINNRNRLNYLLQLIKFLENSNCLSITIIDNNSTYPPLIKYYEQCKYKVVHLKQNLGYLALEKCDLWDKIKKDYFVYTDPDVVPLSECPPDFMQKFFDCLHGRISETIDRRGPKINSNETRTRSKG